MKPINVGGHSVYQNRVLTQLHKYYPDAATSLSSSTWQILEKSWSLDLSRIDLLMQDRYSIFDPEPRLLSDMLHAILVSIELNSYTKFASNLKENYLHTIISGFTVGDTPGVALSMTSTSAFGYPIIKIFPMLFIRLKKSLRSQRAKRKRPFLLKK